MIVVLMFYIFLNVLKSKEYSKDNFINAYFNDTPEQFKMDGTQVNNIMSNEMRKRYKSPKIILRNIKDKGKMARNPERYMYSSLTGEKMPIEDFTHTNMKPFFGGRMKQNMDHEINVSKLENFTGVQKFRHEKTNEKCFNDIHKNVNDNELGYIKQFDRMEVSKMQNNVTPSKQIRVGPGYSSENKYESKPSGGFNHSEMIHSANMYKDIDDLRVKTNPKVSYEGVVVDGHKEYVRGEVNDMNKNRVETFYEKTEADLFKTTGAYTKASMKPCQDVKKTARQDTTQEYKGTSYDPTKSVYNEFKSSGPIKKTLFGEFGFRNANVPDGQTTKEDHGRKNVMVYQNERDITSTKTRSGNITTLIKSLIAPIQDIFKPAQKEYMIKNARAFGGNVNGHNKQTIYDPNSTAKTTIKETTIHNESTGNINGHLKQTIYDPNSTAKTTIKETTIHNESTGNINGPLKQTIYDPNGIARTTIKETTIHDKTTGNMKVVPTSVVYDPKEVAKVTLKETMKDYANNTNIKGSMKATLYNPDDGAKTTVREMTEDAERDGNVSAVQQGDAYKTTKYSAKNTNKEMTSDSDYYGMPENADGNGYETAKFEAKNTQKELLSDKDYMGISKNDVDKATSYEAIYNSVINDVNESLLDEREPTNSSAKVTNGKDAIKNTRERNDCNMKTYRSANNYDKITSMPPSKQMVNMKHTKSEVESDRLDSVLVDEFNKNPYTQSLHSSY